MRRTTALLATLLFLAAAATFAGDAPSDPPVNPLEAEPALEEPAAPQTADAPAAAPIPEPDREARILYVMAGNRVRQGQVKEAVRYYLDALSTAPRFLQARADVALVYTHLGAFDQAIRHAALAVQHAEAADAADPDLYHILGEAHQARGLALLDDGKRTEAAAAVHAAVRAYGKAIARSEAEGSVAVRAATYFRLGEISYLVYGDPDAAAAYWREVLAVHAPEPDLTWQHLVAPETADAEETLQRYRRHTYLKTRLTDWQAWARAYLRQLDRVAYGPNPHPAPTPDAPPPDAPEVATAVPTVPVEPEPPADE